MARLLYLCFFMSGAAGLLYEIYWAQRFSRLLGVDIFSHAAVLTAFMGGLALGSQWLGRRADRFRRPLAAYAALELGIGVFGFLVPFALSAAMGPLRAAYAATDGDPTQMMWIRFAVALVILIFPTALMGGTLPVMTRALRQQADRLGEVVSRLYAINTLGAVAGILAGGFILSEWLGLSGTNYTAIALNLAAALVAYRLAATGEFDTPAEPAFAGAGPAAPAVSGPALTPAPSAAMNPTFAVEGPMTRPVTSPWVVALAAGLTGAAAMITQVGWIRALTLSIGSSNYAFTLVVAVFLVGLSLGAWAVSRLVKLWKDAAVPWALSCLVTAFFSWIVMWLLGSAPDATLEVLLGLYNRGASVPRMYFMIGLLAFVVLALPTVLLGMTFPFACETFAQRFQRGTARITGSLYAMNTIGAMVGSALAGLVLIDLLGAAPGGNIPSGRGGGIQNMLHGAAILYMAAGLLVASFAERRERRRFPGLVAPTVACLAAGLVGSTPWDPKTMLSAPFMLQEDWKPNILDYYRESPEATVGVERIEYEGGRNIVLLVNGKPDASTTGDLGTQVLVGQIPMMLHGSAKQAALIGLGSGASLYSILTHPVESVDMIELSQAVVDAVKPPDGSTGPFDVINFRALDDPRVKLIVADGRNHLALTDRKYDVIMSEPSNPWMGGIASLFTQEFFEACRERLNEDGVLGQWLQGYSLPPEEFYRVVRTMRSVFDSVTVWSSTPPAVDFVVVGTNRPRPVVDSITAQMQDQKIKDDLARISINSPGAFLGLCIVDADDLDNLKGIGALSNLRLNTDNWNKLGFAAMRALWQPFDESLGTELWMRRTHPQSWLGPLDNANPAHRALLSTIEDVQDSFYLKMLWDEENNAPFGNAARSLGTTWYEYAEFAEELRHGHGTAANAKIKEGSTLAAQEALKAAEEATVSEERITAARRARVNALVASAADPADGNSLVLLARALILMGRTDDAKAKLNLAKMRSVTLTPELESLLTESSPAAPPPPPDEALTPEAATGQPPG